MWADTSQKCHTVNSVLVRYVEKVQCITRQKMAFQVSVDYFTYYRSFRDIQPYLKSHLFSPG